MAAFQAITEAIARLADEERDASRFFTNTGRMIGPIQRVNVDLASGMALSSFLLLASHCVSRLQSTHAELSRS